MEIDIQNAKIELIQWLTTLEDSSLIQKLIELKTKETKDWWDEIQPIEKRSVELGLSDADQGKLNAHSKAEKIYGKWL
jgi:malonyl CoA-acyl carrier protein transacylase